MLRSSPFPYASLLIIKYHVVWTAYLYYDSPRYIAAFAVNLGAAVIAIGMATATFIYLRRQNRKLDQGKDMGRSGPTLRQQAAGFRYML
jgi:NADH:ubiquinone oxidoreductase subunit K